MIEKREMEEEGVNDRAETEKYNIALDNRSIQINILLISL